VHHRNKNIYSQGRLVMIWWRSLIAYRVERLAADGTEVQVIVCADFDYARMICKVPECNGNLVVCDVAPVRSVFAHPVQYVGVGATAATITANTVGQI